MGGGRYTYIYDIYSAVNFYEWKIRYLLRSTCLSLNLPGKWIPGQVQGLHEKVHSQQCPYRSVFTSLLAITSFVRFRFTFAHWLNAPLRFGPLPMLVLLILSRAFNVHLPNAFLVFEICPTRNAWLKLNYHHSNTAVLFTTWHFVSKLFTALLQ